MRGVGVIRSGRWILDGIDLEVESGQHWVVLGPNGAGKSTLVAIGAARMFPSRGGVWVVGLELGAVHLSEVTPSVGFVGASEVDVIPTEERVLDAVVTAAHGVRGRWRESYEDVDLDRGRALLERWGVASCAQRPLASLSDGERKRALIARALMTDPELLILDEPAAGLDVAAREGLVGDLEGMARDPHGPSTITVTHHFEEIPRTTTHALILNDGRVIAQGPIHSVLTDSAISAAYGTPLRAIDHGGRWSVMRP